MSGKSGQGGWGIRPNLRDHENDQFTEPLQWLCGDLAREPKNIYMRAV